MKKILFFAFIIAIISAVEYSWAESDGTRCSCHKPKPKPVPQENIQQKR